MTVYINQTRVRISPVFFAFTAFCIVMGKAGILFAMLTSLLVHELAHAAAAMIFDERIQEFYLSPLGASITFTQSNMSALTEGCIAAAGPLISFIFAAVVAGLMEIFASAALAELIVTSSITLSVINLIPAIPLDGGRLLRAILATKISYKSATRICAVLGFAISAAILALSVFAYSERSFNPMLAIFALLIAAGAANELVNAKFAAAAKSLRSIDALRKHKSLKAKTLALSADTAIGDAMKMQRDATLFAIMEDGMRFKGMISAGDLLIGLTTYGESAPVSILLKKT